MSVDKRLSVAQVGPFVSILADGRAVELLEEILVQFKLEVLLFYRRVQGLQNVVVAL